MTFESSKKSCMRKMQSVDKSKKGSIDREIRELIDEINSKPDYYTTSSCAGRILLMKRDDSGRKDLTEWFISSHEKISLEELKKGIEKAKEHDEETWLKQESIILHIACRDISAAKKMLDITSKCGFKRAGVLSLNRNIIEIIGSDSIYTLIAKERKVLVDDNYLLILLSAANKRMEQNEKRIQKFFAEIKKLKQVSQGSGYKVYTSYSK